MQSISAAAAGFFVMDDDDLCYVSVYKQSNAHFTSNNETNGEWSGICIEEWMKKTRNWNTAHQDYPPKISPKSKCLHTFYARTRTRALHFLFLMVEQKFAMPIHCYNIVHELTSIHLFAVPPSSLFQFRQQENLRNISAVPPTTNQQWPHKTNDWSKNLLFTNVQIVFVYVHEWMHIKYLHIIYSKCVRWEKERGGDLKWQWSKHDKIKTTKMPAEQINSATI